MSDNVAASSPCREHVVESGVGKELGGKYVGINGDTEQTSKLEDSRTPGEISVQCFPFANSTWVNGSWTRETLRLDYLAISWIFGRGTVKQHVHLFPCKMQRNSRGVVVVTRGYVVSKSLYGNWLILCIFLWSKLDPPKTPTPGFCHGTWVKLEFPTLSGKSPT